MALRITHTNNSSGHDGTYVYRSTAPMDHENLPAPIADVAPVALGSTFEYADPIESPGDYYYRTQDHAGVEVSPVSAEVLFSIVEDFTGVEIGDYAGGGVYAGIITYADGREFHLIGAKQSGEIYGPQWGNYATSTGSTSNDDGWANQENILNNFPDPAAEAFHHCRDYESEGFDDWYLPARNEQLLMRNNLLNHAEFSTALTNWRWDSTEQTSGNAWFRRYSDSYTATAAKNVTYIRARPVRRVPV